MKVLITGARAPASMDMMRSLIRQGFEVYSADSMAFPLGRFVKGITKHFTIPKPNTQLTAFIEALKDLVISNQIDLLIPTCEEIFFVSQGYKELAPYTRLLCEPFARLDTLHNKHQFNQLAQEYGLDVPESWLLTQESDKDLLPNPESLILKPVYSRFGSHLVIKPSSETLAKLDLSVPYLAQNFVEGKEYCTYALVENGRVLAQASYHPKYTSGPAAGIYFEPVDLKPINDFVRVFCKNYEFSGQIAFDFIVKDGKAFALECNPRVTSGFHLLSDHLDWQQLLAGKEQDIPVASQPYMLGLAMKLKGLHYFIKNPKNFTQDYLKAHDVLKNKAYPWLGLKSFITISNISLRMIKEQKSFHRASTDDIEFNGGY